MDTIAAFMVALGFDVNQGSLNNAKKSVADYEKAVRDAEKRIEDARWEGAKSAEQIAKLTMETNLKEARAALAAAEQKDKAEKDAAQKREGRHKEFTASMSKLALAATAMATAVSFATNRVTQAFDHLGFVSARTGASVQSLNSLSYAFKQVGGSSQQAIGAVESFAKAIRENSGVKSYVQSLGVDMTADTSQQLLQTVEKLNAHPYDVGFREAGLAGISEEDYNLISRQLKQIKAYRVEYDTTTKSLGVNSEQAAEASMAFQRSLTRLQATASALGDKLMVSLVPALKAIVDRFQDWIRSNPEKVEHIMDGISKALVWVAEMVGALIESITGSNGDAFIKKWDAFAERVERFATAVERIAKASIQVSNLLDKFSSKEVSGAGSASTWLLEKMGVLPPGSSSGPGTVRGGVAYEDQREKQHEGGITGAVKKAWRATKRALGGGEAEAHGGPGSLPAESDGAVTTHGHRWKPGANSAGGKERVASWLKFFQGPVAEGGMGADLETSRAMVAMMQGESTSNLNPAAAGDPVNGRNTSFGTAQWHNERFTQLKVFAGKMGVDWTDVGAQQQFLRHEFLRGKYRGVWNRIQAAPTGEAKLRAGIESYEVPKFPGKAYDFRLPNLHALRRSGAGVAPADAANSKIIVPQQSAAPGAAAPAIPGVPRMMQMPNFDVNAVMQPAPSPSNTIDNSTSSRAVHQTFHNQTTITGSDRPREAARIMESAFGNMHSLALQNAQSATV